MALTVDISKSGMGQSAGELIYGIVQYTNFIKHFGPYDPLKLE